MRRACLFLLLLLAVANAGIAKEAKPLAEDPELEKRVMALSQELRCLVCQNETLADSRADLAVDLRRQIREQMKAGKSDKEIVAFLTDRYGDFVLYKPPVTPRTYLLWFGPFLFLVAGLAVLYLYVGRRRTLIPEPELTAAERRRAEALLKENKKGEAA